MITPGEITAFEMAIASEFNRGTIKAPIHLDGGNEAQLHAYFSQNFTPGDWICCSWRAHAKALLAGVPPEEVHAEVMAGRSITLCFPKYQVISSAIVGGILPIALGLAMGAKRRRSGENVHCFVGDMTARGGQFHECRQLAIGHDLPITFIVENNGKSVKTDTEAAWGSPSSFLPGDDPTEIDRTGMLRSKLSLKTVCFSYTTTYPHSGTGTWIRW